MNVIARSRQDGKTTLLVDWLLGGKKIDHYPGWSRILLVDSNLERGRLLRMNQPGSPTPLDYHQIYTFTEWSKRNRGAFFNVEIAIDNVDLWIRRLTEGHRVAHISLTGTTDGSR